VKEFLNLGFRSNLIDSFRRTALEVFDIVLEINQCIHPGYAEFSRDLIPEPHYFLIEALTL
jgi:hypothetical protein